jgi:hypothetical protein
MHELNIMYGLLTAKISQSPDLEFQIKLSNLCLELILRISTILSTILPKLSLLYTVYLKVLSSEMDPAEIRLIRYRSSLKREAQKVFRKIRPPPHPPRALQSIRVPPYFLIANYTTI